MLKQPIVSGHSYSDVVMRKSANSVNTSLYVKNVNSRPLVKTDKGGKTKSVNTTSCVQPTKKCNINRVRCIAKNKMQKPKQCKVNKHFVEIKNKYAPLCSLGKSKQENSTLVSTNKIVLQRNKGERIIKKQTKVTGKTVLVGKRMEKKRDL